LVELVETSNAIAPTKGFDKLNQRWLALVELVETPGGRVVPTGLTSGGRVSRSRRSPG
jgi:hypothetical protein